MTDFDTVARRRVANARAGPIRLVAIVLGSGLGEIAERIAGPVAVSYGELPGFPRPSVQGHAGRLVLGRLGGVLVGLLILYVGTQLIAGMVMAVSAEGSQKYMMYALPLIFVPIIINFPAGLVVYWITTNVWTIGQSYAIQRFVPAPATPTPAEVAAAKPPPPPPRKKKKRR